MKSLISLEDGIVSGTVAIAGTKHSQSVPRIYDFFLANNADAVVNTGTDDVIYLHHFAGKNTSFNLLVFSFGDSETDGFCFYVYCS